MNNADFRSLLLKETEDVAPVSEVPMPDITIHAPQPRLAWPELVQYDGNMVARAIRHDRPDVRLLSVSEDTVNDALRALVTQSLDGWEALSLPLTENEMGACLFELVVVLVLRTCQSGRGNHDTTVALPPWVMRRRLDEPSPLDALSNLREV